MDVNTGVGGFFGNVRGYTYKSDVRVYLQGLSEYFDLPAGGEYEVQDLVFYANRPPGVRGLRASAPVEVLTFPGEQTQLEVIADFSNKESVDVHERAKGTTYWTSDPTVATVGPDGLVTAVGDGDVSIGVRHQWSYGSVKLVIDLEPITSVTGFVFDENGAPAVGADVTVIADMPYSATAGADGSFLVPNVTAPKVIAVTARIGTRVGSATGLDTVYDGFTDAGVIELEPRPAPFFPGVVRSTASPALGVALADFNRDSFLDLAILENSDEVSIALGNGNALFPDQDKTTYDSGGTDPSAVLATDVNGDLAPDLVVAHEGDGFVTVRLNDGAGQLGASTGFFVGDSPSDVAALDFNTDGLQDLVVPRGVDNLSVLLRNTGGGSFAAAGFLSGGSFYSAVAAGDLDGDGDEDVALLSAGTNTLLVHRNNNNGGTFTSFTLIGSYPLGGSNATPTDVAIGDVDGDTDLDVAVTMDESALADFARVFLNDGAAGMIDSGATLAVGEDPTSVVIADVTGDLLGDLFVSADASRAVFLLPALGGGAFDVPVELPAGQNPKQVALGDIDGDGDLDLASANRQSFNASTLLNLGGGVFEAPDLADAGAGASEIQSGDLDGANGPDLVLVAADADQVTVHLSAGGGAYQAPLILPVGGPNSGPTSVVPCDVDQDGDLDLCVLLDSDIAGSDSVEIFENVGGGAFVFWSSLATPKEVSGSIQCAQFDAGGLADLVVVNDDYTVSVFLGAGAGAFGVPVHYDTEFDVFGVGGTVEVADVDGVNGPDLLVAARVDWISFLPNNGDGTFAPYVTIEADGNPNAATALNGFEATDLDGDGDVDVAIGVEPAFGGALIGLLLLENDGTGVFTQLAYRPVLGGVEDVAVGDFDGKLGLDVAALDPLVDTIQVFFNDGAGGYASPTQYLAGGFPASVIAEDLNGDGKPDLAIANRADGRLSVHLQK